MADEAGAGNLIFTRRAGERVLIDEGRVVITVLEVGPHGRVRLAFEAPPDVRVDREEVVIARRAAPGGSE